MRPDTSTEGPRGDATRPLWSAPAQAANDASRARSRSAAVSGERLDPHCAILAHELRGPLGVLCANIDGIDLRLDETPEAAALWLRDALARQRRAAMRVHELLEVLLESFQLESGAPQLQRGAFDLCELVRALLEEQADALHDAGCSHTLHAPEPVVGAWDRTRLRVAIANLIDNARKYGRGAPIEVDVSGDSARASLRVRDHGVGIAAEDRERIFEPFARVRSLPAVSGFGLGLWLVRNIARAHGGDVELCSAIGQGASFVLRLPRA